VEDVRIWQNKNVGRFEIQLRVLVEHVFDLRYRYNHDAHHSKSPAEVGPIIFGSIINEERQYPQHEIETA
jgi:hypothetical protein